MADDQKIEKGAHDVTDVDSARAMIDEFINLRIDALLATNDQRPSLLLSGGIDSILIASYLSDKSPDVLAVHFCISDDYVGRKERSIAAAVAEGLGMEFVVAEPTSEEFGCVAQSVAHDLSSADVWEVCAGAVLRCCDDVARKHGANGLIFTGAGADALFCGGKTLTPAEWASTVQGEIASHFTYHRNIPDFYSRILADPERHVQLWQSHRATQIAQKLNPYVVRGKDFGCDKWLFREMAKQRGIAPSFCFTNKDPMQSSSGAIRALECSARLMLSRDKSHIAYSDPLEESSENIIGRLWLMLGQGQK
ncbi:asparagine synthase-related protein [Corynebacterium kalinowskii]|uniref:asparagine synthase-related protein n=1 Tax=Corynebacterium kalinowskii TaxID=2675216 RepID=UPI0012E2C696|nr:asparagine synthase-related protein [Corynebacterium kalinowskii]